jgi:hypothetical protein
MQLLIRDQPLLTLSVQSNKNQLELLAVKVVFCIANNTLHW